MTQTDDVLGTKRMVTVSTEVLGSGSASNIISVYQQVPATQFISLGDVNILNTMH